MNKTLLAIPLVAGAIAVAGCGGSGDQSAQAKDPRNIVEVAAATAPAAPGAQVRRASGARAYTGLRIVNRLDRTMQLRVTGVDNFDWANGNRPDHRQPQGFQYADVLENNSVLAPQLDINPNAKSAPFNVQFFTSSPTTPIAEIRLERYCSMPGSGGNYEIVGYQASTGTCWRSTRGEKSLDFPRGKYTLRLQTPYCVSESSCLLGEPGVLTITSTANPRW